MPRLKVHRKGALPLATTLVNVARCLIEVAEHWHKSIAVSIGTTDVGAVRANVGDGNPNASSQLRDERTLLQRVINALHIVGLHLQQKARRHLWPRGACIEECRRSMCEATAGHEIIGLNGSLDIAGVDAARHAHQHMLRALYDLAMYTQEVGLFQGLIPKIIIIKITSVVNCSVDRIRVFLDKAVNFIRNQRRRAALLVVKFMHDSAGL
mmetsp:Transcript_81222/g.238643  ORF Transcript_81222/g.238643 Transcript_81222/m.238643 type:complete len:210 (-) Transcript_81222:161-790(-)